MIARKSSAFVAEFIKHFSPPAAAAVKPAKASQPRQQEDDPFRDMDQLAGFLAHVAAPVARDVQPRHH